MIGTATPSVSPDTFTLTVPKADVSLFKSIAKKMGWKIERKRAAKPRLYDPESGDYLNDATMKVIEDARKGKDVIEVGSMDEYLELVKNIHQDYLTLADRHSLRPVRQEEQTESKMRGANEKGGSRDSAPLFH